MESAQKDTSSLNPEPEASIDIKDDLSESQYVEIGSPSSHQAKANLSKSGKRPLNPFGKQNKKEVTSHLQGKRSSGSNTNKATNGAAAYTTHQSDKAPYARPDQDVSPSFSSETTKAINYLTFSAPNLDRYESFMKYLQNKPQTNTNSATAQPASLTDRLIKEDAQDDCKCSNSETCPHTKQTSSALRTERSHITFNMEALKQLSDRETLNEHPTPTLKIENLCQDAVSIESDSSPQNLEEATRKALQNLSFKLEASQSSENIMSNISVNSEMYRHLDAKDSKEKVNSQFNLSKYLTPNLSEIKRNSITNELNMLLHRPSQQSEFMNTDVVLNISTLTANSSRKESTVEKLREFMAQRDAESKIEGLEYNTKDGKTSSDKNESTPEHHHNFNRNNFASITSSTGYKSAAANQKKALQGKNHASQESTPPVNHNEERGIAEHLLKFAAGEIEPNSFNELSFSMDNPLPEKLSISSPERLHTEPSSIRNDSNLFGTNSEVLRNHSPDNCEKHTLQLIGATKNINVRTFMMLRSLIKPNENILLCCQAFVKLFAGLSEAIPSSFANMDKIEWGNIKVLFNAPLKILNLISSYTSFVEYEKIPQKNMNAALASLAKIPYDINTETQNEAFYQMYEYVVSAIEYHKYYKPGTLYTPKRKRSPVQDYQRIVKTEADYIQDSPPTSSARSKSPLKSSTRTQDLSTVASHRFTKTSASPIRDPLSTRRTPLEDRSARNVNNNTSLNGSKSATKLTVGKKSFSAVKSKIKEQMQHQLSKSSQSTRYPDKVKRNQEVDSYLKNLLGERQNTHQTYRTYTEGDQDYITERARTLEPVWVESSRLVSETERRRKETTEYRGKTGRLLADHERYVKRLMKARAEAEDELDRELKIQERERLEDYLYVKREMNKSYDQQLAAEKVQAKRETKVRQAKAEQESINDDIVENMKHHCYLATQNEKKKFDKKKQLWEQYKNILAEKMAKKKAEAKETHREKQEIARSRINEFAYQKQQATENRDKWVSNYMLLSKLIGNAR